MQLQLHAYGLIVGVAVSVLLWLAERWSRRAGIAEKEFWQAASWMVIGALVGARLWHVMTDWSLYVESPLAAVEIWRGGLSILGAVFGGAVGILGWRVWTGASWEKVKILADALALALPIGQAIGRWGNYVNQELYGFPTNLPWGIFIDPVHRLSQFRAATHFHPLFAYEMICVLVLWAWLRRQANTWPLPPEQRGWLAVQYVVGYAIIRFWLDFGRPDRPVFFSGLSLNQWILGGIIFATMFWFWQRRQKKARYNKSNEK